MSTNLKARAWMEVDAAALRRNLRRIRDFVGPDARLVPMVKADAYGLGMAHAVEALGKEEPWGFGVAAVEEGAALRAMGFQGPVIVFSPTPPGEVERAVHEGLTLTVSDVATLDRIVEASAEGRASCFHAEIDTGMGRAGFDWREVDDWGPALRRAHEAGVSWQGCYTHLHSADVDLASVEEQAKRLEEALARLELPDGEFLVHLLNSPGSLRAPRFARSLVRPGIFLYGGSAGADLPEPEAVAAVRARVVHVRDAPAGSTVGYGATHVAERPERWATAAIGYGDGLPRCLGNRGSALVLGHKVPIIGRISMDVTVVDISDVPSVEPGDVVTFIGYDGDSCITVDEVASLADTISYEILTGFTPRVPRVWDGLGGS